MRAGTRVEHPGVWEQPRFGYLHELLISRRGIPAAIAVLLAHIMQRLLVRGAITFAVRTQLVSFYDRRAPLTTSCCTCHGARAPGLLCCMVCLRQFTAALLARVGNPALHAASRKVPDTLQGWSGCLSWRSCQAWTPACCSAPAGAP